MRHLARSCIRLGFPIASVPKHLSNLCLTARRTQSRRYSSAPSSLVTTEIITAPHTGSIAILRLSRPEAKNAISKALLASLSSSLDQLTIFDPSSAAKNPPDAVRALIIASSVPGVFCAGADLKERLSFTLDETHSFLTTLRDLLSRFASLPIPTLSALSGHALGGGLELALTSTFRVASSAARLGLPETRLAIIPGAGGTHRLPALVGRQRALEIILTGRALSAVEAEAIGLVDRVVLVGAEGKDTAEAVVNECMRFAEEVLRGGPIAIGQALRAVKNWEDGGKSEAEAYEVVLGTEDRNAALRAFKDKEKKAAVYEGK